MHVNQSLIDIINIICSFKALKIQEIIISRWTRNALRGSLFRIRWKRSMDLSFSGFACRMYVARGTMHMCISIGLWFRAKLRFQKVRTLPGQKSRRCKGLRRPGWVELWERSRSSISIIAFIDRMNFRPDLIDYSHQRYK